MRLVLATIGTHGDVCPLIALGQSLCSAGHKVTFVSSQDMQTLVESHGLRFEPVAIDFKKIMNDPTLKTNKGRLSLLQTLIDAELDVLPSLCLNADLLIGGSLLMMGRSVAESQNIPFVQVAYTLPILPSKSYPCLFVRNQRLPPWVNKLSWKVMIALVGFSMTPVVNRGRKKLGLSNIKNHFEHKFKDHVIITVDKALAEVPADVLRVYTQTDYWHLDQAPSPLGQDIIDFVHSGSKPIYIGLGSMPKSETEAIEKAIHEIIQSESIRVVMAEGWAELGKEVHHRNLKQIGFVDHHKLFPLVGAVVHHGGSGTVHTAALSGVPQIIVPATMDQPWWGETLFRCGLAPEPRAIRAVRSDWLRMAIKEALGESLSGKAAAMGRVLRANRQGPDHIRPYLEKIVESHHVTHR